MNITTTVTKKVVVNKNIELPYCSKKGENFYRINEDESVLRVWATDGDCSLTIYRKSKYRPSILLDDAVSADPCSGEEVEEAVKKYFDFIKETINTLAESI